MKRIYYVVEKEVQDVDGVEETTGNKNVCAYHIVDDGMVKLCDFDMLNSDATVPELLDNLPKELQTERTNIISIQL